MMMGMGMDHDDGTRSNDDGTMMMDQIHDDGHGFMMGPDP